MTVDLESSWEATAELNAHIKQLEKKVDMLSADMTDIKSSLQTLLEKM